MIPLRRLALALLLALALVGGASALDGYDYYQTIEYAGCDQSVYQQDIVIHRSTGTAYNETAGGLETWHIYVGEHCREDYGDVRFTNSTGAEFAYYLWPDYTSSSARFAVRLEGADTAGTLTVWYGNPSATTTSDPDATYDLWCDFLDAGEVAAVFDVVGTPSTTYADSVATITCDAREFYQSKKTFSRPARVEFRMADTGYGTDRYPSSTGFGIRNQGGGGYHVIREAESGAKYALITCNGGTTSVGAGSSHDLAFQDYQIDWVSGTSASLRKNGVVVSTVSSNIPAGTLPVTFGRFHYMYSGNQMRIDWILVRAYSAAPPAATAFLTGPAPEIPPTAAFTASPTSGTAPLTVQFTDASTSSPTAWAWTFGDGGTSAQQHPSHTYDEPGTYTVSLTATNAGGSDTETKTGLISVYATGPYSVATYADLCKVGTGTDGWTLDADYIQTADIQCPAGASFTPIGTTRYWFTGSYDGRGYVIRDLFIDMPDGRDVGLFGGVKDEAVITNVTLEDISITGKGRIGGLVGQINSGTGVVIENCTVSGTISGEDTCVGGLIGYAKSVTITNCHTDVEILGETGKVGGLIGYSSSSTITDCHATGNVIGEDWATGGLVGQCYKATVARCYASGNVSGSRYVGGLIGYYEPRSECSLEDCYATGNVFSSDSLTQDCSAGGLIGRWDQYGLASDGHIKNVYSTGSVSAPNFPAEVVGGLIGDIYYGTGVVALNAYWDTETSGQAASAGGAVGKTTAEMKTIATFAGWNIAPAASLTDEVWYLVPGEDYPRLAWEGLPATPPVAAFSAAPTSGTAPLTVQFTDASTNSPSARSWSFGDGGTSTAQSPSHTYSTAGTYTVALTVTNAGGSDTETKTGYITVSAAPPTAPTAAAGSPAFPYSQQRKETLSFLLMCWGGLAFVGVFCVVIFLLMNGAQRGSGGI